MRLVVAVSIAVVLLAACACCAGQVSGHAGFAPQGPHEFASELERSSLTDTTVLRELKLGPYSDELYNTDFLPEMHRLFQAGPGGNAASGRQILRKAIFALPLLRRDNAFELAVRPEFDIIATVGRRLTIRGNRKSAAIVRPEGTIAIDTHVHTCASPDSLASASEMLLAAAKRGLTCVAITDHDTISGAVRAQDAERRLKSQGALPPDFFVISGEEISSSDGHIIGLFLTSDVPSGKNAEWTVQAIHDQGGLAIAAHPMLPRGLHELANSLPFDAVETESASEKLHYAITPGESWDRRAAFYASVTKPRLGASDTHDPESIAECYTLVKCAPTPQALRDAILAGSTTPVASISDAEECKIVIRPMLRCVSTLRLLADLSPLVRRYGHTNSVGMSILPRPVITYSRNW